MGKTAILAGASGLVGRHCLHYLLEQPAYARVIIIVRRPLGWVHPKLDERMLSFEHLGRTPPPAADHAFCALGTTMKRAGSKEAFRRVDFEYAVHFAYWVRGGGAQSMAAVSSVGADPDGRSFYLAVKGEMELGMREQGFPRLDIFRPSLLTGGRKEFRPWETVLGSVLGVARPLLAGSWSQYRPVAALQVGAAMVAAAQRAEAGTYVHTYRSICELAASG